jgi:hypothetical protein
MRHEARDIDENRANQEAQKRQGRLKVRTVRVFFIGVVTLLLVPRGLHRKTESIEKEREYKLPSQMLRVDIEELNSEEAMQRRALAAREVVVSQYEHQSLPGFLYLQLLLRVLTTGLHKKLPEPVVNRRKQRTNNGGCNHHAKIMGRWCLLTWDGWARAMATGDVLYDVLQRNVQGAVVEVGVWRGGMCAYLQGMLKLTGQAQQGRELWLIDSFQGLPPEDMMRSTNDRFSNSSYNSANQQAEWAGQLSFGRNGIADNFDFLDLLLPNVHFLEGFIQQTLLDWNNVSRLAFLRIDVDIYSATYDALHFLYPKLSRGGAVLFDDWKLPYSKEAILNYRKEHNITTPVQFLPGCADPMAYWIKEEDFAMR